MRDHASFERDFPALAGTDFKITHPASEKYNCFAWSIGQVVGVYWPSRRMDRYWPRRVSCEVSVDAFTQFYRIHGFEVCDDPVLEPAWEKVALYAIGEYPTHAVRQLASGRWTSKMGEDEVLEIADPTLLEGDDYGRVVKYFRRKRAAG